jgi:alpha-1,2-mannosyltransferase
VGPKVVETIRSATTRRILILLVLGVGVFIFLAAFAMRHGFFDLKVYYGAIRYWAHGDGEVYDYLKPNTKYGFTYPPFAALVMLPMAVLPWIVVTTISWVASGAATVAVLYWLVGPTIRARRWTMWFSLCVGLELIAIFEPYRETINFGQVNVLLVFLVVADLVLLLEPDRRWRGLPLGGALIGLATAIKLTPGIFILYLLAVRRYRAALTAAVTAAGATVLAMAVAPNASREFWTAAFWDTDRVGTLSFISNQSWQGMVSRLDPAHPNRGLWAALVLATLAFWAWRTRRLARAGDLRTGLALTGVAAGMVSPVTWVHHLVWVLPAVLLLVVRALSATGRRRMALVTFLVLFYGLLSSRLVWYFAFHFHGWGLLGSNAYLIASVVMLVLLPGERASAAVAAGGVEGAGVAHLGEQDGLPVRKIKRVRRPLPVGDKAEPFVEPARLPVGLEHP